MPPGSCRRGNGGSERNTHTIAVQHRQLIDCVTHTQTTSELKGDEKVTDRVLSERNVLRNRNRRRLLGATVAIAAAASTNKLSARAPLKFGTTPVFLDNQIALLGVWQRYLEERLARPVQFVQRGSYREIIDLLLTDAVDAAWVCGYPLLLYEQRIELLGVPRYQGAPLYQSYLIVPERDSSTRHISDLRGQVYAFSDPLSNSGYLVPRVELIRAGTHPAEFFRRSFFTFAHRKVVEAVQAGLANGGSVDGYVWDTLVKQQPGSTSGVRVAWRSPKYGFPPLVARTTLSSRDREPLAQALFDMSESGAGSQLLERLNIEGFERGELRTFDGIRELIRVSSRVADGAKA